MTMEGAGISGDAAQERQPRTERGRKTLRKLLDAAVAEFGDKGYHDGSISGITRRAGVALGSFYTYFESKDEIFRAVVKDFSGRVRDEARGAMVEGLAPLDMERQTLAAFLRFAREHKEIYRIIDEAEFVDPESYRGHYETTAQRIHARLRAGMEAGVLRTDLREAHAWAIMGMNVFLGLRYMVWDDEISVDTVAEAGNSILRQGIVARD